MTGGFRVVLVASDVEQVASLAAGRTGDAPVMALCAAARSAGVRVEHCLLVHDDADLRAAAARIGMPAVAPPESTPDRDVPLVTDRHAVRVLCVDTAQRVLLMHWRDPVSGDPLWEPPGGRVESGESTAEAARRELAEETGIRVNDALIGPMSIRRDYLWCGRRYRNVEQFFGATAVDPEPAMPPKLSERERQILLGHRWWTWADLLPTLERIEPPEIASMLRALASTGPWSDPSWRPS